MENALKDAFEENHRLRLQLAITVQRLHSIIEPWIGARADIVPPSVTALVAWYNELYNFSMDYPADMQKIVEDSAIQEFAKERRAAAGYKGDLS